MKNQKKQNDEMKHNQPMYNTLDAEQDQNNNADQNKQDQNKNDNKQCK